MVKWTKEGAIEAVESLVRETESLVRGRRLSAEHARWLATTLRVLEEVFGGASRYFLTITKMRWHETGSFIVSGWDPQGEIEGRHHQAYLERLDTARGLLQAALDELRTSTLSDVYRGKDTPRESSGIVRVLGLVERKLRKAIRTQPPNERAVQNALETLLIGADIDYSREGESIEYSSKTYIPDFRIPRLDLVLEAKLCAREGREKELIAEINDDILAYKTKYGNLIFAIYDVGFIRDVDQFAGRFEENEGVLVRVIKH